MLDIDILDTTFDLDADEIQRQLDDVLAAIAKDPDLTGLCKDARPELVNRQEMRRRHLRMGRLLQRAGRRYFERRGQKPPEVA
jgi:hypothetical protein